MKADKLELKTGHTHYMPTLDGVRALACLLVVVAHIEELLQLNHYVSVAKVGTLGVVIFFSLSGFLMGMLYLHKSHTYDTTSKYLVSRFSRITPTYYISIVCCWILYLIIPGFHYQLDPVMLVRSFMFMSSEGVFWSLPPEIQFYLFFFFLWFAYDRAIQKKYAWFVMAILISIGCIATKSMWGGLLLPSKLHIFMFGILGSFAVKNVKVRGILHTSWFQILIVLATLGYFHYGMESGELYNDLGFAALVGLGIASFSGSTSVSRPFATDTMRLIGNASFSIYLIHDFLLHALDGNILSPHNSVYLNIFLASLLSISIPVAFHFCVEKYLNETCREKGNQLAEKLKIWWLSRRAV